MIKKFVAIQFFVLFFFSKVIRADEGMWIPLFLSQYNIEDMKKLGFKLTADDIYNVNAASLKDAVVLFGRGCTGELISNEGLLLTNHHCGYNNIQFHSSVENDYLTNGYWAMNREQELPNPSLSVSFLVRMEDVSQKVLSNVNSGMSESVRQATISKVIEDLEKAASENGKYQAVIKPFFYGNEYYLFISEVFRDVRLVGAPPSSIGKFGGDTDNWDWPRHTGDFCVFRIYADKNNQPASYSKENVPYKPKKYFPIYLGGVKEDDFTMVYGYPGRTQEYLTSFAVQMVSEVENPHQINLRQQRINILKNDMGKSAEVRIKYSAKYAGISNYWKKWMGETAGLRKLGAIEKKRNLEKKFQEWANSDETKQKQYGTLLAEFEKVYNQMTPLALVDDYLFEGIFTIEALSFALEFRNLLAINDQTTETEKRKIIDRLTIVSKGFFKNYNAPTDKKIMAAILKTYRDSLPSEFHAETYKFIDSKFKGNYEKFVDYVFEKSILVSQDKVNEFLVNFKPSMIKKLRKDPVVKQYLDFIDVYISKVSPTLVELENNLSRLNRLYIKALREMQPEKKFYPDANSTLRISYGKVKSFNPRNGVTYHFQTTLDGAIEKSKMIASEFDDYNVSPKLKSLFENKDYGNYAENGKMPLCFIATNHTTGGNSGSPVLNANGYLIGINFDRTWEGTMSDIMYHPDYCRNITLDIRYVLFVIEKFAGAKHLINEMTLIK